ncbi:hypothetical protein CBL_07172 [Carabus blaptoides fortunei]
MDERTSREQGKRTCRSARKRSSSRRPCQRDQLRPGANQHGKEDIEGRNHAEMGNEVENQQQRKNSRVHTNTDRHGAFSEYLTRIGKMNDATCEYGMEADDTWHTLFNCELHAEDEVTRPAAQPAWWATLTWFAKETSKFKITQVQLAE